jgi:hypothetical protein
VTCAVLFEERQHPGAWTRALLLSLPAAPLYGFVRQVVFGQPFSKPMSGAGLGLLAAGTTAALAVLWNMELVTQVRPGELDVRFWPFARRRIPANEIVSCEVRTYRPIREYGGWGVRYGFGGMAYNMSGNRGVQLELAGGKRVLIGSQRPEELAAALRAAGAVTR